MTTVQPSASISKISATATSICYEIFTVSIKGKKLKV
jgi:hypothetical protein